MQPLLPPLISSADENDLQTLGHHYQTDKVTHHAYHSPYAPYLAPLRKLTPDTNAAMLEIGIEGKKSLHMWLDYLPGLYIYGLDIHVKDQGPRHRIYRGDQSHTSVLQDLTQRITKHSHRLVFINDDGSHAPAHQLSTFAALFPSLEPGGIYIIEDIETSYWTHGQLYGNEIACGYHHAESVVEAFKHTTDDVMTHFLHASDKAHQATAVPAIPSPVRLQIASITFAHNCIIIRKKTPLQLAKASQAYNMAQFVAKPASQMQESKKRPLTPSPHSPEETTEPSLKKKKLAQT